MSQLIIIGGGKMGQAILTGLTAQIKNPFQNITIIDPLNKPKGKGFTYLKNITQIKTTKKNDVILIAVKPQIMKNVLRKIPKHLHQSLIVSIAAGTTTQTIAQHTNSKSRIIRAMPNTPAQIGKAMTFFYPNENCTQADKSKIKKLFSAIGKVKQVNDENLMHAITAISGSGPAYLFYFTECMINIAQQIGLSQQDAQNAVLQTINGATELMLNDKNNNIKQLRENVTSPKGTTEAAMKILANKKSGLENILKKSIKNAQKRSKELN